MDKAVTADAGLMRLAVEQSPDALVICTPEDTILLWSPGAEAIFGWTSEEAVGQPWCELVMTADQREEELRDRAKTATGDVIVRVAPRRHKDGRLFYAEGAMRAISEREGGLRGYMLSTRDVTPLAVTRDSQLLEDRYRDLIEWVPDAIVIVNEIGRIVLFNAQSEAMFGAPRGQMLGRPIESLLPERYGKSHVGYRMRYAAQPQVRRMGAGLELFGLRSDGREFPVEISLSPLAVDARRFVISAIRDISAQKEAEQLLQEKNAALQLAHQAKDRFLATMSHELRTPLNAILGFTGILLMKLPGPLNGEQERQLEIIKTSGQHLLSLINDLLDLAKIQSGTFTLAPQPLDLCALVVELHSTLQPLADRKSLLLAMNLPPAPLVRTLDRRAVNQIVLNLANNAIKFTEHGTVVLELAESDDGVRLSVVDSGVGISAEDQERLFNSFTQVGDPRRRPEGTGLGLHLSQRLAQMMGAHIEMDSTPGVGSRFTLVLPPEPGGL